jgi:hypothetical protein
VGATWGYSLCANFSAECEIVAASGITIFADKGYNLPDVFPWSLGAMGTFSGWANSSQRQAWNFSARPADAVLMELGENDCHAINCTDPADLALLTQAYESFVAVICEAYGGSKDLPIFLSIANHEAGQSAAMLAAIPSLLQKGYTRVAFLNATAPDAVNGTNIDNGCAGHPSAAQQEWAYLQARPVIAQALGW